MSRPRHEFSGVTVTKKYVTVHYTASIGGTRRADYVRVPLTYLVEHDAFVDAFGRAAAAHLKAYWEGDDVLLDLESPGCPPWSHSSKDCPPGEHYNDPSLRY